MNDRSAVVPPDPAKACEIMRLDRTSPGRSGRSEDPQTSGATLPITADPAHGATNLATIPYAGNISTDTRAGV